MDEFEGELIVGMREKKELRMVFRVVVVVVGLLMELVIGF